MFIFWLGKFLDILDHLAKQISGAYKGSIGNASFQSQTT